MRDTDRQDRPAPAGRRPEPARRLPRRGLASALSLLFGLATLSPAPAAERPLWKQKDKALVLDAYEMNIIDWEALATSKRVAGFIAKATDGLPEVFDCKGKHKGDSENHCRTMWRKYSVSSELYRTRRLVARSQGLLWGAYHLARPGNPVDQANHFLAVAKPGPDELMALDIEGLNPDLFMSLADAEIFARHIKARTGRWPVLYTNHVTARFIAARRDQYRLLSRLPLWYARYRPEIDGVFPMGNWQAPFLWQFSSGTNCNRKACPLRVAGTLPDIDVNVADADADGLKAVWAAGTLVPEQPPAYQLLVSATAGAWPLGVPGLDATVTGSISVERAGKPVLPVIAPVPVAQANVLNYQDF